MRDNLSRRKTLKLLAAAGGTAALPGILTACGNRPFDADVIVIGAGLSGLNAALILQEQGADVMVLEGSNRIGGRVFTLDDVPGRPDAGGSEFSVVSYARIVDMIDRLKIPVLPWRGAGIDFAIHANGRIVGPKDWPTSPANLTQGAARNVPPAFLGDVFMPRPSPLPSLEAWLEPDAAKYDKSYREFLQENGADAEVIRLIESRTQAESLDGVSALWHLRSNKFNLASGGLDTLRNLDGGMSRLTDGMANLLQREVRFDSKVVGIRSDANGVEIRIQGGASIRARFAICTIPLTMLRDVAFDPALPKRQAAAVAQMPYGYHSEVFLSIKEPFWEQDGLPPSTWSDGRLGMALKLNSADSADYLWAPISGPSTAPWRDLSDAELMTAVVAELARMRPSTAGRVEAMAAHNWNTHPWTKGHLVYRAPGQIDEFGAVLTEPHLHTHFAGEHTAVLTSGMEGAMESGERAALEILLKI